jgi:hypothetical protein
MIDGFELPEPADGRVPWPREMGFQLRRMNRIASALFSARPVLGELSELGISAHPDSDHAQIHLHLSRRGSEAMADELVARLGWDPEPSIRRHGVTRQWYWHGMLGGFRAYLVWVEEPDQVDSQGRDALPAGVGVGDRAADAVHVAGQRVEHPGVGHEVVMTSTRSACPVPPMHADLQRLGYEL